ncbi:hypothetical protein, partial [Klebsiella pneumoniae]|uniref:hypothetical protein n=1 Tax=Klebsiella pneumoniae TaxID=573 RepID=UPI0025A04071
LQFPNRISLLREAQKRSHFIKLSSGFLKHYDKDEAKRVRRSSSGLVLGNCMLLQPSTMGLRLL